MSFSRNVGRFLVIIGVLSLVIFFLTQSAGQGVVYLCVIGSSALVLGFLLLRRSREPEEPSQRFRTLRRRRARKGQTNEDQLTGWEPFTEDGFPENEKYE